MCFSKTGSEHQKSTAESWQIYLLCIHYNYTGYLLTDVNNLQLYLKFNNALNV
jgi:hypothetical protein